MLEHRGLDAKGVKVHHAGDVAPRCDAFAGRDVDPIDHPVVGRDDRGALAIQLGAFEPDAGGHESGANERDAPLVGTRRAPEDDRVGGDRILVADL